MGVCLVPQGLRPRGEQGSRQAKRRHCERSEAISATRTPGTSEARLLRFARNDNLEHSAHQEATMYPSGSFVRRRALVSILAGALAICAHPARAESDLARAYRIIAGKQLVDLTHSFSPDSPVWAGFGQAKFTPAFDPKDKRPYTIAEDGFRATYYDMVGQYGTHVDPPAHFDEKGITMD